MRIFFISLFSIIAVAAQLTFMPNLSIFSAAPNLILAGALAWGIFRQENKKRWIIIIPILLFDLIAGQPFGLISLSLCLTIFSLEELGEVIFKQNDLLAVTFLAFFGVLIFEFFKVSMSYLFSFYNLADPISLSSFYFYATLPFNLLINGALSLFFLWVLRKNQGKIFKNNGPLTKFR